MNRSSGLFLSVAATAALVFSGCSDQMNDRTPTALSARSELDVAAGGVYTMTNATDHNEILAFRRNADGGLTSLGAFGTGGVGTGGTIDPLASQYAIALSEGNDLLFAVNAGSHDVSVFGVNPDASLDLIERVPSGGVRPVSLATRGQLLYVLNAGDNTISGFRLSGDGLSPIPSSTRHLAAGAAGASTIHFTRNGQWLIVTERVSNRLETFRLTPTGLAGDPTISPSSGAVPFGFDVTPSGLPIVSEAGGAAPDGAVSSYRLDASGGLSVVTASLDATGPAACWLILTSGGNLGFVVNSASSSIASLDVTAHGVVTILDPAAALTGTGSIPLDLDLVADRFLYVLEGGTGNVAAFELGEGGHLTALSDTPAGRPSSGMQGMAAW